MKQYMDIFSLPEMTLLCCVNDYFMKHNIDYEPVHLYKDVKVRVHRGPSWQWGCSYTCLQLVEVKAFRGLLWRVLLFVYGMRSAVVILAVKMAV